MSAGDRSEILGRNGQGGAPLEGSGAMVEPEVLLPSQYYELIAGRSVLEGERRLMLAILEDAVSCYQRYVTAERGRSKRLYEEAADWLFDDEQSGWVFSFESVCSALALDPVFLRRGLAQWREAVLQRGSADTPKFSRIRLRAARRHRILPLRERRRKAKLSSRAPSGFAKRGANGVARLPALLRLHSRGIE